MRLIWLAALVGAVLTPTSHADASDCRTQGRYILCGSLPDDLSFRADGSLERVEPSTLRTGTNRVIIRLVEIDALREKMALRLPYVSDQSDERRLADVFEEYVRQTARELDLGELSTPSEVRCYLGGGTQPLVCASELLFHGAGRTVGVGQAARLEGGSFLIVDLRSDGEQNEDWDAYSLRATAEDWLRDVRLGQ